MGSLIQRVVFNSEKTHTTTYGSDGSRLGGWTIPNGPAQKTARFRLFLIKNEYIFNVDPPYPGPMHPWDTGAWLWRTVAAILHVWIALIDHMDGLGEL